MSAITDALIYTNAKHLFNLTRSQALHYARQAREREKNGKQTKEIKNYWHSSFVDATTSTTTADRHRHDS
jgi:hypothetical protein